MIQISKDVLQGMYNDNFSEISEEIISILLQLNIIVEQKIDEMKIFYYHYDGLRLLNHTLGITFLPTYHCNCKCVYCYAEGRNNLYMDQQTENYFLDWLKNILTVMRPYALDFCFHGGEPFLAKEMVFRIAEKVNKVAEQMNLQKDVFYCY